MGLNFFVPELQEGDKVSIAEAAVNNGLSNALCFKSRAATRTLIAQ